ncbi:kinetochore CENP-C fungal-like protein [Diplogelasinospora grovesii]|uniref:CENP-C homolog n=1 Tax=Diplogelasinospora grovesii TaxID=303347 RepID=A0AAN6S975_9PEZI|nr:kinetochore CENP-C fungal-like protein [Diplogelasinospora grovesii]
MAPRSSQQRRTIAPQNEHIYELGVAGRKTGITLKDTGIRDEHGMEPLDALFSSPRKATNGGDAGSEEEGSDGEEMDITNTSGVEPAALLNGHGSRLPMPLPRSRSPLKTNLKSPAQRNRHIAANSSSPTRGSIVRDREREAQSGTAKRKLDFGNARGAATARSMSQPVLAAKGQGPKGKQQLPSSYPSYRNSDNDDADDDDDDAELLRPEEEEKEPESGEESMAMLNAAGGDDDYDDEMPQIDEPEQQEEEEQEEEVVVQEARANARGKKGAAAPRGRKPAQRVPSEEPEPEPEPEQEEEAEQEQEEEEEQELPQPKKRGRPRPKNKAAPEEVPDVSSESRPRKRRSLNEDSQETAEEPSARGSKRQRAEQAPEPAAARGKGKGRPPKKTAPSPEPAAQPEPEPEPEPAVASSSKAPGGKKGRGRPTQKAAKPQAAGGEDAGDTSMVVPRGPPLPKSRGLLINRREVPGDGGGMTRTRSGRNSFKPLAFWRNEHVDYDHDEAIEDHFAPKSHGSKKFLLPSIKEVHRVEEPEPPATVSRRGRPGKKGKGGGGGKGRRKSGYDDDDGAVGAPDPWELDPGTVDGDAVVWQPEHEFNPPALDDEVEISTKQLAISGRAIQTREIKGASFRFAKTLSEPFFGAGVVDLPPGSEKRPKNSRKMFMTFFVYSGRVLVTVNETSFRIGKGGMWFVPRGNYYSIENDYDQPARIFFSQGCEMAVQNVNGEGGGGEGGHRASSMAAEQSYLS